MSEAEDFEWNEICAKIAYEEEKLLKGNGRNEEALVLRTTKTERDAIQKSMRVKPFPDIFEPSSSEVEQLLTFDNDCSLNSSKCWKDKNESIASATHYSVTSSTDFESLIRRKQGEISILRQRLDKLEKEKFEAVEAYRLLQQESHKRNSSSPSQEKINQLKAEVIRLQKMNEFYCQEINSMGLCRREKLSPQEENDEKHIAFRFDAGSVRQKLKKEPVTKRQHTESRKSARKGKNVVEEFETIVTELNQHDQNRLLSHEGPVYFGKGHSKESNAIRTGKSYSFQTATSLHIPPSQDCHVIDDKIYDCVDLRSVDNMDFLSADDLVALKRLVLNVDEELSSSLLGLLKLHSVEEDNLLQDTCIKLHMFIESLLQILESERSLTALEDASIIFHSIFLRNNELYSKWGISNYISLERILTIVERIMKETVPLMICFNISEGAIVILKEFQLQRVSENDIESILRFLKHFSVLREEETIISAQSLFLDLFKLVIDILFLGKDYMTSKPSLYSDSAFHLVISYLSSSSSCLQLGGVYFGYKFKEFLAFSLGTDNCISLTQMLICTLIREYLTLSQFEFSMYLKQRETKREEALQRLFLGRPENSWILKSDRILFIQYSLQTCHFMIHHLKEKGCSLNFLFDYSVPLLYVLKAIFEDRQKAFGNLREAYEMWSVICNVMKNP